MIDLLKKSSFFLVIGVCIVIFLYVTRDEDIGKGNAELNSVEVSATDTSEQNETLQNETKVIVDVKGEVIKPGVFEVDPNVRVNDVIQIAGGFTENADQSQVNLAQKVQDEMIIFIPKAGAGEEVQGAVGISNSSGKVRINYATQEEIESITGIGPSKAQAILQYREEHGLFRTVEDLLEVSGIGEKTLEVLKGEIQVP
ncbi:competence protein ComEA [Virgibacillus profundi]|uniref:Competence protein ComEA n=1 Tax=Virgibacillus profundi TaxID=2024555 RepID=A0A2A2IBK4_9BACI|nr:helix-hairpin-helix domain-containing protein [Virgibacillus profundi]PAV28997.1 competence protein ComEA [Virgibacillus profundi]PXY53165.1 competence protein ComEA [Virgibacillus profundi]